MDDLMQAAREAMDLAYVPYSEFPVGAAIETADGSVFAGTNMEVANFSNSLHAEEVAIARARMAGHESFARIAVTSERRNGVTPCGMCRQTLAEFAGEDLIVLTEDEDGITSHTLGHLLPQAFSEEMME
ncbi:cytidine deaminase [Halanaeroarchaeum sulfurireducens]|uniref:cytidine deaminase n=1 Tax=Halanaeroarchaeum sulfurireducens TaxID=1604004 RepID=A0A0F7P9Z1_9EURY|nr:cytidine deaminase [Halanaeroarchaeum sulfurireducens]AKH97971.1 cytidine deaminase [Halanaeroarchaeum sulfurireducens]ALG82365.1 cytidine deaminase [Halanaeroarchaeum sulfurireducens]